MSGFLGLRLLKKKKKQKQRKRKSEEVLVRLRLFEIVHDVLCLVQVFGYYRVCSVPTF